MEPLVGTDSDGIILDYRAHVDLVYGYLAHRLGGRRQDAEELTQEVFVAYVRAHAGGQAIRDVRGWLITVARNKLADHLRRETRALPVWSRRHPDEAEAVDSAVDTDRLLSRLPERQRVALILRYVDDLPVDEVARLIGIGVSAAESLLSRGRKKLEEELS